MVEKLFIKNFRNIKEAEIEIKLLTIITGEASSGKSSILDLIHYIYSLSHYLENPKKQFDEIFSFPVPFKGEIVYFQDNKTITINENEVVFSHPIEQFNFNSSIYFSNTDLEHTEFNFYDEPESYSEMAIRIISDSVETKMPLLLDAVFDCMHPNAAFPLVDKICKHKTILTTNNPYILNYLNNGLANFSSETPVKDFIKISPEDVAGYCLLKNKTVSLLTEGCEKGSYYLYDDYLEKVTCQINDVYNAIKGCPFSIHGE